eukprot:4378295-Prorocentrum_lima.AAC.1
MSSTSTHQTVHTFPRVQFRQVLRAVATELIRVTYVTATSLQKLAQCGENHKRSVDSALTAGTTSVETQMREQSHIPKQEQ